MIELTTFQLFIILVSSGIIISVVCWFLGFLTFKWYVFYRARRDPLVDDSNEDQTETVIIQLATHAGDFTKMYFLTGKQLKILAIENLNPIKCFPDIGKDKSEYGMVRPPAD